MEAKPLSEHIFRLKPAYIRQNGMALFILVLMLNGLAYVASPLRRTSQEAGLWVLMAAMTFALILVGITAVVIETRNLRELRFQARTINVVRLVGPSQPFLAAELTGLGCYGRSTTYRSIARMAQPLVLRFSGGERIVISEGAAAAFGVSLAQIEARLRRLYPHLKHPGAHNARYGPSNTYKIYGDGYSTSRRTWVALEAFENAVLRHPDYAALKMAIGEAHFTEGRFEQAARAFRASVTVSPGQASAWRRLGQSLLAMGFTPEARESLEKALELAPEDAETHASLALIHTQRGDERIARYILQKTLRQRREISDSPQGPAPGENHRGI